MSGPARRLAVPGVVLGIALTLILAASASAYIYWGNGDWIARANLDGSCPNYQWLTVGNPGLGLGVFQIAVDGSHIYWTTAGNGTDNPIGRANLDGSAIDRNFMTGLGFPTGLAIDSNYIYWADDSYLGRANLDGSGVDTSFITMGVGSGSLVAVDAAHIYWSGFLYGSPSIDRANLDGSGVDPGFITGLPGLVEALAVDGTNIFWASDGDETTPGTIGRANLDGSGVDANFIAPTNNYSDGLALDAGHMYWANNGTLQPPSIARANLDGSGTNLNFTGPGAGSLAVDAIPGAPCGSSHRPARAVISHPTESNRIWREPPNPFNLHLRRGHPPTGTTIGYTLSKAAQIRFDFTQLASGRSVGHRCVAPTLHNHGARKCRRTVIRGSLDTAGHRGLNKSKFFGWLTYTTKLAPGTYTLVITATTPGAGSTSARLRFAII